ncbi:diguanylate cyclase [Thioclava sp. JE_KL1]|uniref:GGDEF domain-containing protein n=1 Tax=Thioclava sp. JE_KL1 TaxID=2651187 RepID=UPI00128D1B18|nr:GGDEF domain-containing protein [Thioclava sp. JE_KL1]MPQ92929.1 GGDEF domain-containing protein [Thioclava sp. JE_KL1]
MSVPGENTVTRLAAQPPPDRGAQAYWLTLLTGLLPMFLWLDEQACILGVGRTLRKVLGVPDAQIVGAPFSRFFSVARRGGAVRMCPKELRSSCGAVDCDRQVGRCGRSLGAMTAEEMLHVTLRMRPQVSLRGALVGHADQPVQGGAPTLAGGDMLLNFSFGIHLRELVAEFDLTEHDFSAADLAMEMLYLQEAKSLVLEELRALTGRLDQARKAAEDQALSDPLTKLANRRAMAQALARAVDHATNGLANFALLQIDLDHFKTINDTQGHAAGDFVLQLVARNLCESVRGGDLVARMGGDEFLVLLRGDPSRAEIGALAARIIEQLEAPKWYRGQECLVSGSLGAVSSRDYESLEVAALQNDVDRATYAAKAAGRGCLRFGSGPVENVEDGSGASPCSAP